MSQDNFFAEKLLAWYDVHRRELPWRGEKDVYRVWVSEIILQQTQVVQGWDYYRRFVERFPSVESLAEAREDEVMKLWEGLGYYSRARNLHAAAQQVMADGGVFPRTYEGVRALKGVGDSTAGAICSLAYGLPVAAVDGNGFRVLTRCFAIDEAVDTAVGQRMVKALAQELIDEQRAGDFNQAMMDLGAMVCTPRPQCEMCPLNEICEAYARGDMAAFPRKRGKTKVVERRMAYVKVVQGDHVLIRRRNSKDVWRGLYEYVLVEPDESDSEIDLMKDKVCSLLWQPNRGILKPIRKGVKHVLSHRKLIVDFYMLDLPEHAIVSEEISAAGYFWVSREHLDDYAFPALYAKVNL